MKKNREKYIKSLILFCGVSAILLGILIGLYIIIRSSAIDEFSKSTAYIFIFIGWICCSGIILAFFGKMLSDNKKIYEKIELGQMSEEELSVYFKKKTRSNKTTYIVSIIISPIAMLALITWVIIDAALYGKVNDELVFYCIIFIPVLIVSYINYFKKNTFGNDLTKIDHAAANELWRQKNLQMLTEVVERAINAWDPENLKKDSTFYYQREVDKIIKALEREVNAENLASRIQRIFIDDYMRTFNIEDCLAIANKILSEIAGLA